MPLIKDIGKAALQKNIKTEISAGKKPKQAVAIAYSVQREAKAKKKRLSIRPWNQLQGLDCAPVPSRHR